MPSAQLPGGGSMRMHRGARLISTALRLSSYRVQLHRQDRFPAAGPVLVVANHSSIFDGPLLLGIIPRPTVFLIKYEMFRGPLGVFLRAIGQLPVRRGEPDRTPLLAAIRVLRAGGVVGIFPEGTRGVGDVAAAQRGAAWLARSTGATVQPIAIRGTYRPTGAPRRVRPQVDMLFGEPLQLPEARGKEALAEATERVRSELAELVAELDRIRGELKRKEGLDA
ncbi:1-acyl-sn-glycerol-3-phosphate acyltransferase [Pseudonocardiaceae bacterium YIM PH 21723]|nr:1-acyl-sn-glycerol-3-phosphate acyltransferase [Pseudonocardiaceae bacterium YIM PH 21723]